MKTNKIFWNKLFIVAGILIFLSSCVPHEVNLSVPGYSEEALTWCGPATGQMIMDGYPPAATSCFKPQEDIWDTIQDNKVEAMWDTDPEGLKQAMIQMCPPMGTWVIHDDTDSEDLMYTVAWIMTKYKYPTATVLNTTAHVPSVPSHTEHWVVIKGFVSDKDPVSNTSINLQSVTIIDPVADIFGNPVSPELIPAAAWYTDFSQVTKAGSSYLNKYVVITEPPERKGKAIAKKEILEGKIIKPELAIASSLAMIKKYRLASNRDFKNIKGALPIEPILVDKDRMPYYIVPFVNVNGNVKEIKVVMLINAYDGSLRRVKSFENIRYISKDDAIKIAQKRLQIQKPDRVSVELVNPGANNNPYLPYYRISLNDQTLFVDQKGESFTPKKFNIQ